jgi:hypothetical protein
MVHDQMLDREQIDRFKLLILPNTAALSDAQCEQLRGYVKRGGSLLASFETSLYDEFGPAAEEFRIVGSTGRELRRQRRSRHQELLHER